MAISSVLGSSALLPAGLGFRNVIINGGMDVWQRGTSTAFTSTASTSFLADRWSGYRAVAGSTQSRVSSSLSGFQYAMRIQRDSGNTATNRIFIGQSFETSAIATFAGKRMALSFYARAGSNFSATSSLFTLNVYSGTGTECNVIYVTPTSMTTDLSTTFTLTTSWQLFTAYYNVPSGVTQHGLQFDFAPVGTAGANDYVDITGVQLEQNYQPTPFEQRPIGTELALCQRYYYRLGNTSVSGAYLVPSNNIVYSASAVEGCLQHPVPMRISSVTFGSNSVYAYNVYQGNWVGIPRAAVSSSNSTTHAVIITDRSGGTSWSTFVTGTTQMAFALVANTSAGYIEVSAEL